MNSGQDLALLVGGPDGLGAEVRAAAAQLWSLSALTLPHPLVRVVLAEQLYRAWSILRNHPLPPRLIATGTTARSIVGLGTSRTFG